MNGRKNGFSLTELLVVVAVIAILASILIVSIDRIHVQVQQAHCQNNLEQIGNACRSYAAEYVTWPMAWNPANQAVWYDQLRTCGFLNDDFSAQCPLSDIQVSATTGYVRPPVSTDVVDSVNKALWWFQRGQGSDGSWGCVIAGAKYGMTALALEVFQKFGHTENASPVPQFQTAYRRAMDCVIGAQNRLSGAFPTAYGGSDDYNQAVCTLALAHAVESGVERARVPAQGAFERLAVEQARGEAGGFQGDWSTPRDMSTTGWGYQALEAARDVGLAGDWVSVNRLTDNFFRCSVYLTPDGDQYQYTSTYIFPDTDGGGGSSYCRYSATAGNYAVRALWGQRPATAFGTPKTYSNSEIMLGQKTYLTKTWTSAGKTKPENVLYLEGGSSGPATWGDQWPTGLGTTYNLHVVYYLTLGSEAVGGADWDAWKVPLQIKLQQIQSSDGSFYADMSSEGTTRSGTAYTTALGALCFQASVAEYLEGTPWPKAGDYSYGYNQKLAQVKTPADNTVALMDYMKSIMDQDDPLQYAAPRHGGKVNVLFYDGHVEALVPDYPHIPKTMFTPEEDDDILIP